MFGLIETFKAWSTISWYSKKMITFIHLNIVNAKNNSLMMFTHETHNNFIRDIRFRQSILRDLVLICASVKKSFQIYLFGILLKTKSWRKYLNGKLQKGLELRYMQNEGKS